MFSVYTYMFSRFSVVMFVGFEFRSVMYFWRVPPYALARFSSRSACLLTFLNKPVYHSRVLQSVFVSPDVFPRNVTLGNGDPCKLIAKILVQLWCSSKTFVVRVPCVNYISICLISNFERLKYVFWGLSDHFIQPFHEEDRTFSRSDFVQYALTYKHGW